MDVVLVAGKVSAEVPRLRSAAGDLDRTPGIRVLPDHLFERANVGLATACATVMLITVIAVLTPWLYSQYGRRSKRRTA